MKLKRFIVVGLEKSCNWTHFITLHRPWLWWFHHCPLATLAIHLDEKWKTKVWK